MAESGDDALQFDWGSAGEDALAAKIEGLIKAIEKLGGVTQAVTQATATNTTTTEKAAGKVADAGVKWNSFNTAIGLVARGVGTQNAALGQMIATVGQGAASIGAMTASMGPLGLVLGIASTAFSLYEQRQANARRETDALRASSERLIPTLESLVSKIEAAEAARARMGDIMQGRGSGAQRMAAGIRLREQQASSTVSPQGSSETDADYERRVAAREQLNRQTQELLGTYSAPVQGYTFTEEEAVANERRLGVRSSARRGGGSRRTADPWDSAGPGRTFGAGRGAMAGVGREVEAEAAAAQAERDKERQSLQGHQHYLDARAEMDASAQQERMRQIDEYAEYERGVREEQMRQYQMVSGIAIDSLGAILASDRAHLSETMKNMGIGYGWKAVGELAAAVGTEFIPGFQAEAAGHWASFAIYAGAAAALGAGAAATAGGGGGRGSGGGGAARPEGGSGGSTVKAGPTIYNVYNGPIIAAGATEHEVGRTIGRIVRRADDRDGRS